MKSRRLMGHPRPRLYPPYHTVGSEGPMLCDTAILAAECPLWVGKFKRSMQHYSLDRSGHGAGAIFPLRAKILGTALVPRRSGDVRHLLTALPALSGIYLQLQREPCPCMSFNMHAIPTSQIRVEGCCVDRLRPPGNSGHRSCRREWLLSETIESRGEEVR